MKEQVGYVLESSRNNPDAGPSEPPLASGMWVWWRTGPHPEGVWQVMDMSDDAVVAAWRANEQEHSIHQDAALGSPGDWGHRMCHACNEMSEGYPEPRHKTNCDGVCRRLECTEHTCGRGGEDLPCTCYQGPTFAEMTREELESAAERWRQRAIAAEKRLP